MLIGIEATHANKAQRTGVENYCWHIIQGLKKQIPSSVRVVLYSNKPLLGELGVLPENWEVKILRWPFKKLWSQIMLSLELLFHPPDIFFAPAQLIPLFSRVKKTVVTIHDSAFLVFPKAYNFCGRQYLKWMNKMIVKKSSLIITPSEFSKQELLKQYCHSRECGNPVVVIPEAYDNRIFRIIEILKQVQDDKSILKKYNLSKPFVMSLGRLEEKKNTAGIIKAFEILKKDQKNNELKLLLAGSPRVGFEKVKQALDSSEFKADILTPGWISEENAVSLFNLASVFVFPSFYEGFGLPVLEAMACGCPVVASAGNSLKEVGGESVLYVDPGNANDIAAAINKLLHDENLRAEKIKSGLERVKNFSWEKAAKSTWEAIGGLSSR